MGLADVLFLVGVGLLGYAVLAGVDRAEVLDEVERFVLAFPAGLAALGALLYTLNILGIPFALPLVVVTLATGVSSGLYSLALRREHLVRLAHHWWERRPQPGLAGWAMLAAASFVVAGYALQGYFAVDGLGDTRVQHFPYAAIVFRTHCQPVFSTVGGSETLSLSPALFECYAALWTLAGHIEQLLPNLLPLALTVCWCLLTVLAARRVFRISDTAGAFAVLLFASLYELKSFVGAENVDFLPLVLGSAAGYLASRDRLQDSWRRAPLIALLLGLAGWTKLHGLPFGGCLVLGIVLSRGRLRRETLRGGAVIFVAMIALLLPLLIRNALAFGNPLFPAFCGVLGGALTDRYALHVVVAEWQPAHLFYAWPVMLALTIREAPVVLGLPVVFLAIKKHRPADLLLAITAAVFLLVFLAVLTNQNTTPLRFAGPALGILCWLGARAFDDQQRGNRLALLIAAAACAVASAVITLCLLVLVPRMAQDATAALVASTPAEAMLRFWWPAPMGGILLLFGMDRGGQRASAPPLLIALWLAAIAVQVHRPVGDLFEESRLGALNRPDWSATPEPSDAYRWLREHTNERAVVYSCMEQPWLVPGALLPAQDPLLEPIHRPWSGMGRTLERLRMMGAEYVLDCGAYHFLSSGILYRTDPVLTSLGDRRYFIPVCGDQDSVLYRICYPEGETPARPSSGHPMPWTLNAAAHGPMGRE